MLHHPSLLAFLFLGGVSPFIPLIFHIQKKNFSLCCLCTWLALGNIIPFINGIVWNTLSSTRHVPLGQGYCDISARLFLILQPCLMGCAAAILRYLAIVLSSKGAMVKTKAAQTRSNLIEAAIIFGPGLLIIILQLTAFQYARYYISPFLGCLVSIQATKPAIILYIWSPLMGLVALYYAFAILWHLNRKRKEFAEILHNSESGLNVTRFARLFVLAGLIALVITPINLYVFSLYAKRSIVEYTGSHQKPTDIFVFYSGVGTRERDLWFLWFMAFVSITLSALLGIGKEAAKTYRRWMVTLGITRALTFLRNTSYSVMRRFRSRRTDLVVGKVTVMSPDESTGLDHAQDVLEKSPSETAKRTISDRRGLVNDFDLLSYGHNRKSQDLLGKGFAHVWSRGSVTGPTPSPGKVRVNTVATQHFTAKDSESELEPRTPHQDMISLK